MKGTNTIILNEEQMLDVMSEWWAGMSYSHKTHDVVKRVYQSEDGNFEITIEGVIDEG